MAGDSLSQRKAQLDKAEREHLEDVVTEMRERVEDNVEFQLTQHGLDDDPDDRDALDEETRQLVEAIELEAVDGETWSEAFKQYVMGVGYTIVNRLAALRCMEVRNFIDEEVTVFTDNGLTPAAETLVHEEFLLEDEAILEAYHNACDGLAEEIEILFDRSSAYSLIDPDPDTFEALCEMLDSVPDEVWRADDVLGWVYEYYNTSQLSDVRGRMRTGDFDADDVAIANQFYTPHWVARLLTDNAVGKQYLQSTSAFEDCLNYQSSLDPVERINRDVSLSESPSLSELCTYIVPSEDEAATISQHPSEIQVLDPTCGSGHFLLYGFDVLERVWRDATDIDPAAIPAKILEHNLYGIDIDLRACQLAAFNLYLKARGRAEAEGADTFEMPSVGIVCADNQITEAEQAYDVIETLADANSDFASALETVLDDFRTRDGLGSLLDVKGTLEAEAVKDQTSLSDWTAEIPSLSTWIDHLHEEVEREEGDRFFFQNLQSFLRVVFLLTKEYDTVLMNPPYGGHRRMPKEVKEYVEEHYAHKPEYYTNFLEQSGRLLKPDGQIGMLVPRSFMYKESFEDVREELIEESGTFDFDFLLEFGKGILDNATVRTVGTVLRASEAAQEVGEFVQLSDVDPEMKEETFARVLGNEKSAQWRHHAVNVDQFRKIPGGMLTYWTPPELRELYTSETVFDAAQAGLDRESVGAAKKGIDTGNNDRFVRYSWECKDDTARWRPYAKGGESSWFHYPDHLRVLWDDNGREIDRNESSTIRNKEYQGTAAVTWPLIKDSGHRFAQFGSGGISDNGGPCLYPDTASLPYLTALLNSRVYTGLMLAQTPERQWNLSDIAILPYFDVDSDVKEQLIDSASQLSELAARFESFKLRSGRYGDTLAEYDDLDDFVTARQQAIEELIETMRSRKNDIDTIVVRELDIGDDILETIEREAEIRYGDFDPIPYDADDIPTDKQECCERLLSHLVIQTVRENNDGIVETYPVFDEGSELHDAIIDRLDDLFRTPASDLLAEIDDALGSDPAESEPYPNIGSWVRDGFFDRHCAKFENTPIVWEFTTTRLVADSVGEGFRCLVDYTRVDPALFDRLEKKYLEPRKADLRERRTSADRRRSDDSLSAGERAAATETFERSKSGLQQVEQFQEAIQLLVKDESRDWSRDDRELAESLAEDVKLFSQITEGTLQLYDQLVELTDEEELVDMFSESFIETLEKNKTEWLRSLADLRVAAESYARPESEPVEAHHYDLLGYFGSDLMGSVWPTSTGVLSIGYYPKKQATDLLNADGEPKASITNDQPQIIARIASEFDEYESLADEIESKCDALSDRLPTDWSDRALSEITTAGYQPKHKHGVEINITPLADAEIVPKTVDDQVL